MTADLLATVTAAARRSAEERARVHRSTGVRREGTRSFEAALRAAGPSVIAECKRRSPSRGILRPAYDPAGIARQYEQAGAAAISVLTEPTFFDGSLDHLRAVRAAVRVPLLRKDFIVSEFQIVEAVEAGADAVLLIVAALQDDDLRELMKAAGRLGMAVLVEVHDEHELDRALVAGAQVIGVNSRNLRTLAVDPDVLVRLAPAIPAGIVAVAESGLKTGADLHWLQELRYDAFLIGERLIVQADPGQALAGLLADARVGAA